MRKTYPKKIQQKRVFVFAVLIFLLPFTVACKKKKNPLGLDSIPQENIMSSRGIDTFSIKTYTILEDSVNSTNPEFNLLGSYHDEVFGLVEAGFYTQLTLSGFAPDFGDLNQLVVDSAVMAFEYGGYYGYLSEQLFEVYEIVEDLSKDSVYTRKSVVQTSSENLVLSDNNQGLITPNTEKQVVVGEDTLLPQLRLPLNKTFAKNLLSIAETATDDKDFTDKFKGFYFKVNNPVFSPGKGAILYLASLRSASKMTVYYTDENDTQNKFDFIITGSAVDFNHFKTDYSATRVQQVVENPELGNEEFYAHAFAARAKVEFPSIINLPKDVIIHSATLELPINYYEGNNFTISAAVNVTGELFQDDKNKYIISTPTYNKSRRAYIVDLRSYIQKVIKGEIQNNGIFVSPSRFNTSAERIIFNGINSLNKKQPLLNIVYTKY